MTRVLVASYADPAALTEALGALQRERFKVIDTFTPFEVAAPPDESDSRRGRTLAWAVAVAGFGVAALVYAMEWFSAVHAYPFNAGGRPLHSWPVFLLAPFELGVLAAAIAGFVTFLIQAGLPRLNHPAFEIDAIERASIDRFVVAVAAEDERRTALDALLKGAVEIGEASL